MVWYSMAWYGTGTICHHVLAFFMVWYGMVCHGMVWYGMAWYGMVWYGMVWHGMVWHGVVWYDPTQPCVQALMFLLSSGMVAAVPSPNGLISFLLRPTCFTPVVSLPPGGRGCSFPPYPSAAGPAAAARDARLLAHGIRTNPEMALVRGAALYGLLRRG